MAANQTSNQKNQEINSPNSARSGQQYAGERSENEQSASASGAIGDMAGQASEYITESAEQAQEYIRDHTAASVMSALVVGFGIGVLVGHAIGGHQREPRLRRYGSIAGRFRTPLMNRVETTVPEVLAEHFSK